MMLSLNDGLARSDDWPPVNKRGYPEYANEDLKIIYIIDEDGLASIIHSGGKRCSYIGIADLEVEQKDIPEDMSVWSMGMYMNGLKLMRLLEKVKNA
jgi:hypothetical protein